MTQQPSTDTATRALAFANGLRKNTVLAGRRWAHWPGGGDQLAQIVTRIDGIARGLQAALNDPATANAAIADLRAILEWTTYQSASVATARAILVARKTRAFAERFGLFEDPTTTLAILIESEASLIENVRTKNGYMIALAERHPHLALPPPLVALATLTRRDPPKPTRIILMQQLIKSTTRKPLKRP